MKLKFWHLWVALFAFFFSLSVAYQYGTVKTATVTVTDKERIVESDGESMSSKYIVFTDIGVYENTDTLLHLKFNSSDIQGKLEADGTYEVTSYGWRVGLLSMYPNIIDVRAM